MKSFPFKMSFLCSRVNLNCYFNTITCVCINVCSRAVAGFPISEIQEFFQQSNIYQLVLQRYNGISAERRLVELHTVRLCSYDCTQDVYPVHGDGHSRRDGESRDGGRGFCTICEVSVWYCYSA